MSTCNLASQLRQSEYVCVAGCGTRSMFFYGLLEYLMTHAGDDLFSRIKGTAGTSSGALVALVILLRANPAAMAERALSLAQSHTAAVLHMSVQALFDEYGMDEGELLQSWIDEALTTLGLATGTTFAALHKMTNKTFAVCTTNLVSRSPVYLSHHTAPTMPLREALYMSMCLPFIYRPRRWKGDVCVDGGLTANIPIHAFAGATPPLVLHLKNDTPSPVATLRDFATSVCSCTLSVQRELLASYRAAHPDRVFEFNEGMEPPAEGVSICIDTPYLTQLRHNGYVAAMLSEQRNLSHVITGLVALSMRLDSRPD